MKLTIENNGSIVTMEITNPEQQKAITKMMIANMTGKGRPAKMGMAWSQEDEDLLRANYAKVPMETLVTTLRRDEKAIRQRAYKLKITQ